MQIVLYCTLFGFKQYWFLLCFDLTELNLTQRKQLSKKGQCFPEQRQTGWAPRTWTVRVATKPAEPLRKFKHPLKHTPSAPKQTMNELWNWCDPQGLLRKQLRVINLKSICLRVFSLAPSRFRTGFSSFHLFVLTTLLFSRATPWCLLWPCELCAGRRKLQPANALMHSGLTSS